MILCHNSPTFFGIYIKTRATVLSPSDKLEKILAIEANSLLELGINESISQVYIKM